MDWIVRRSGATPAAGSHDFPLVSAAARRAQLWFPIHLADAQMMTAFYFALRSYEVKALSKGQKFTRERGLSMTTRCSSLLGRRASLLATIALILTTAGVLAPKASAQKRPATSADYAEFQNSTLSGTSNTINVVNVPVVTSSGLTYDNVTITFTVSSTGTLKVSSTQIVAAAEVQTDGFEAGTYQAPGAGETIAVSGPGVESGGETEWSFAAISEGCNPQYSAMWYVGPVTSSPYYARITAAGVPLTGYSYGVGGSSCNFTNWEGGSLLGFYQSGGNQLVIASLSTGGIGTDQSEPVATITYCLVGSSN